MSSVKRRDIEKVEDTLQSLFGSPMRTMILLSLEESSKSLTSLSQNLGFAAGTVYHRLKELKSEGLVEKKEGLYSLTPLGTMGTLKARETLSYLLVMDKYKKFFSSHDTDVLPREFLLRCSALASTELYFEGVDPMLPVLFISEVFSGARSRIYGITNIGTSEWARILEKKKEEGIEISLLVTEEVYEKIRLKSTLLQKGIPILKGDFRFVLVLTETTMLLALNKKDILDMTNIIVGKDTNALEWGMGLFLYERQRTLSKSF